MKAYILTYGVREYDQQGYYYQCMWLRRPTKLELTTAIDEIKELVFVSDPDSRFLISDKTYYELVLGGEIREDYYTFSIEIEEHKFAIDTKTSNGPNQQPRNLKWLINSTSIKRRG